MSINTDQLVEEVTYNGVKLKTVAEAKYEELKKNYLPFSGGTMTGPIDMNGQSLNGLSEPTSDNQSATKKYVDTKVKDYIPLSGGTMTGVLNVQTPTEDNNATTKKYVDSNKTKAGDVTTSIIIKLLSSGWSDNTQTVTATGVTTTNNVIVAPVPDSFSNYSKAVVRCTSQANNSLTFACDKTPSGDLSVNVMIVKM